jgi:hypothetical protein
MIGQSFVRLATLLAVVVAWGGSEARAQGVDCRYFKVNAERVSAFEEPREGRSVASLEKSSIVCVAGDEEVSGHVWVFIPYQVEPENKHKPVQGWALKDSFSPASQDEVAALSSSHGSAVPPPVAAAPPAAVSPRAEEPRRAEEPPREEKPAGEPRRAEGPSGEPPRAGAPSGDKEIVRYSEPIQSGGFPVQGHSLDQLVHGVPTFPPIAGLPDDVWQKPCSNCHQWNKQTLCQQAQIYAQDVKMTMRKQHPYGGPEKLAMRNWAEHGCQ